MNVAASSALVQAPIKVVRLITGLEVGGAELGLLGSLQHLDRARFRFVVACLYNNGSVGREIERLGIPVFDMRMRSFADPAGLLRLWKFIKTQKPDILHTHLFRANTWGRLLGAALGVPVIISSEHSLTSNQIEGRRRTWLLSAIDTCTALCCDRIIAVSEATKRYLLQNLVPSKKVEVLLNSIDTSLFVPGAGRDELRRELGLGSAPVVTIVARLHPYKNHRLLLEAFSKLHARRPDAKLLIVGSGPLESDLRAQAQAMLPGAVTFTGERRDVSAVMAASDVVVLCSACETFGRALVEAMAAARPVIGTAVDGIPEVIVDGVTGFLVAPGDASALAEAIYKLLADPELAARMGRAGQVRARQLFDIRRTVKRLQAIYSGLHAKRAAALDAPSRGSRAILPLPTENAAASEGVPEQAARAPGRFVGAEVLAAKAASASAVGRVSQTLPQVKLADDGWVPVHHDGKPRILYIITRAEHGGAQMHLLSLARAMQQDFDVAVATGEEGYLTEECHNQAIPVHIVPHLERRVWPLSDIRALWELQALLRRLQPDLIHAHTFKAGFLGRFAGYALGVPSVYTIHSWLYGTPALPPLWSILGAPCERLAAQWCDRLIAVSEAGASLARKHRVAPQAKIITIHNGIPDCPERAFLDHRHPPVITMVARFTEVKEHDVLLRAFASIAPGSRLRLIGSGPLREGAEKLAQELGVRDRVEFLGDREDVAALLATADVFVLASKFEMFSLSILEAMRAGLPVIASDVGGNREAVEHGQTGFLVPSGSVKELAGALSLLIDNRGLRLRLGRAARHRFTSRFLFAHQGQNTRSTYLDILFERHRIVSKAEASRYVSWSGHAERNIAAILGSRQEEEI
jgi:glycosyltransferase involved in cell wall biosynthesis